MHELVDLLVADADMLPCEAAERISVRRVAHRESDRTAAEIMAPIPTIPLDCTARDAAAKLVEANSPILAVVSASGELQGVVTDWDITRVTALDMPNDQPLEQVMSRQVIAAAPGDPIQELIARLEQHEISAMPVVENGQVLGMVNADLLARRSLLQAAADAGGVNC